MRLKSILAMFVALLFAFPLAAKEKKPAPPPPVPVTPAPTPDNVWNLELSTGGTVAVQLRPDVAPTHVERIKTLTRQGFYNGLTFHRVIEGFMAQTGDPKGTGEGGSPLPDLKAEFNELPHLRGTVSMARAESPDSANSQFYIMFGPRFALDRRYTVIGRVISGMQFVDAVERGEPPANPSRILRAYIAAEANQPQVPPPAEAPAAAAPAAAAPAPEAAPPAAAPAPAPEPAPAAAEPAPAPAAPVEAAPAPAPAPAPEAAPAPAPTPEPAQPAPAQ